MYKLIIIPLGIWDFERKKSLVRNTTITNMKNFSVEKNRLSVDIKVHANLTPIPIIVCGTEEKYLIRIY